MNVFKRVEIWVLLAVVGAGLVWVFTSGPSDSDEDPLAGSGAATGGTSQAGPLQVHRSTVERDYGNARLDIEVRVRNDGTTKLTLQPPQVKLLAGDGREIPPFFLPFEPQPEIATGATQDVQLRYWLEKKDLAGSLTLQVNDSKVAIKGDKAFDLETLKTKEQKVLRPGEW